MNSACPLACLLALALAPAPAVAQLHPSAARSIAIDSYSSAGTESELEHPARTAYRGSAPPAADLGLRASRMGYGVSFVAAETDLHPQKPGTHFRPGAFETHGESASEATSADSESAAVRPLRSPAEIAEALRRARRYVDASEDGFILGLGGGGAVITAIVERSSRSLSFEYDVYAGYRYRDWGFIGVVEHSIWRTSGADRMGRQEHALNVGVGLEHFNRSGFLRSQVRGGMSILLRANSLDPAGSVGFFLDLRPLGFHWLFKPRWSFFADVLHLALVAPVLSGVPLVDFQFRTSLGVETRF